MFLQSKLIDRTRNLIDRLVDVTREKISAKFLLFQEFLQLSSILKQSFTRHFCCSQHDKHILWQYLIYLPCKRKCKIKAKSPLFFFQGWARNQTCQFNYHYIIAEEYIGSCQTSVKTVRTARDHSFNMYPNFPKS